MDLKKAPSGKPLRKGYTTGSCAAAAAKSAALSIIKQEAVVRPEISLPDGNIISMPAIIEYIEKDSAKVCVVKDAGDDPDVTNGIKICAEISLNQNASIVIDGGEGVGRVEKEGLAAPPGRAAINPGPMKMIKEAVHVALHESSSFNGADVIISVPEGKEIAKRTFNEKLGVKGGISILGTSGIVEPMSENALKESIKLEMRQLLLDADENETLYLVFGNYGLRFVKERLGDDVKIIKISNFAGEMLEHALSLGHRKICICGHIGKMIKIAGASFNTHSSCSGGGIQTLCAYAGLCGADIKTLKDVFSSNSSDSALEKLNERLKEDVCKMTVNETEKSIQARLKKSGYEKTQPGVAIFDINFKLLAFNKDAEEFAENHPYE